MGPPGVVGAGTSLETTAILCRDAYLISLSTIICSTMDKHSRVMRAGHCCLHILIGGQCPARSRSSINVCRIRKQLLRRAAGAGAWVPPLVASRQE